MIQSFFNKKTSRKSNRYSKRMKSLQYGSLESRNLLAGDLTSGGVVESSAAARVFVSDGTAVQR